MKEDCNRANLLVPLFLFDVNSQSKFHSGNSSGSYFNKKNVVEFSVGRRYPK